MNINPAVFGPIFDTWLSQFTNGYIDVFTGTKPASSLIAISDQTLLATERFPATPFGTTSTTTGHALANAISSVTAVANGSPTFVRCRKADGTTTLAYFTAGVGSGEFNFAAAFTTGATIPLNSVDMNFGI